MYSIFEKDAFFPCLPNAKTTRKVGFVFFCAIVWLFHFVGLYLPIQNIQPNYQVCNGLKRSHDKNAGFFWVSGYSLLHIITFAKKNTIYLYYYNKNIKIMKTNKTYRSLLDKSINSMLSAIEIYNKPNFSYREETFAILAVNAWELLFKAYFLRKSNYNMKSLYVMENIIKSNGEKSTRKTPKLNRAGNPMTISFFEVVKRLEEKDIKISENLKNSLEVLVELRDNAIHFHNEKEISKELQELGFACIKNYMSIIKKWCIEIDISKYNFYLMPLAYIDSSLGVTSITTEEVKKYIDFVKNKIDKTEEDDFKVAISIDIQFKKTNTFDSISMVYAKDGISVKLTEEDIRERFSLDKKSIVEKAKKRYSDFKQNSKFNDIMKKIKGNDKLCHIRELDPGNTKTNKKLFYSTNIWQELDREYTRN